MHPKVDTTPMYACYAGHEEDEAALLAEDVLANKIAALGYDFDYRTAGGLITSVAGIPVAGDFRPTNTPDKITGKGATLAEALAALYRNVRHAEARRYLEDDEVIVNRRDTIRPGRFKRWVLRLLGVC